MNEVTHHKSNKNKNKSQGVVHTTGSQATRTSTEARRDGRSIAESVAHTFRKALAPSRENVPKK